VGPGARGRGQEEELGARLGMIPVLAPARTLRGHLYGNALLSRLPIQDYVTYDLSQHGCEPRFCQRVDIVLHGNRIHIYNVHLGTTIGERNLQAAKLITCLSDPRVHGPKILLGDFNEWKKGAATKVLTESLRSLDLLPFLRWRRTYPGIFPIFHLDHIYYDGQVEILKLEVPRTWLALIASDHMPLVADLRIRLKE
jgi:endonuclease/exonuclease/phosphatase family metal-dependent hydrolase